MLFSGIDARGFWVSYVREVSFGYKTSSELFGCLETLK